MTKLSSFDQRTSYGRNLKNISEECNTHIDDLTNSKVKNLMTFKEVPANEVWRPGLVDELLGAIYGNLEIPLDKEEIDTLLSYACSS